jgi:gliding-associated putative ABC transporter substrate-binding component GldG
MERIWALYKKELRTYFNSPIAYIVLTALLIGVGYFFFQTFFAAGQATLRPFFRVAAWSFLLFGPAVTMKLLAEEKKTGTIEGLLTLPLREWEMVVGKFLAAWTLLAIYLLITLVYPLSISFIGDLDGGPVIGGYLGLFFLGGTFVALGVFASAISRNQVISLIVAFGVALILFVLDLLLPFVPPSLQALFAYIGADPHFQNIGRGVLDSRDAVYSFSLMAFFLFLAVQALQTRLSDHSRKWRINRVLYIGAAIGCLLSLNALSYMVHGRFDATEDRQFTLADATVNSLQELEDQLTITAYFSKELPPPANQNANLVRDLLEEYRAAGRGKVAYRFIDPDTPGRDGQPDQSLIAAAQTAGVPKVDVQAYSKDQVQMVKVYMGIGMQYGEKTEALPIVQNLAELEYELTARVAKLMSDKTPTLGFVTGHGELSPSQGLNRVAGLLGEKFAAKEIDFSKPGASLAGVDVLIMAGPTRNIPESQLYEIDQFLMRGGKGAFFQSRQDVDPRTLIGRPLATGLEALLATYGVDLQPSLVLDKKADRITVQRSQGNMRFQSVVQFPAFVLVEDLAKDSPLTKNLRGFTVPFGSPLAVDPPAGVTIETIARSSEATWLFEVADSFLADPQAMPPPVDGEFDGPQALAVTLQGTLPSHYANHAAPDGKSGPPIPASPETRVAVVGSGMWVSDALPKRLNITFFQNLLDWLVLDEALMSIRTRSIASRPLEQLGDAGRTWFKYGNMLLPPLLLIAFGIVRWRLRTNRKRKALGAANAPAARKEV